jgi:hypothetical protein
MITFNAFNDAFSEEIKKPDFGERHIPGSKRKSAGAKELAKSKAQAVLKAQKQLLSFHKLLQEYERLMVEQEAVNSTSQRASSLITKTRNGRKSLASAQEILKRVNKQFMELMTLSFRVHLKRAFDEIANAKSQLLDIEKNQASVMHATYRRTHDEKASESLQYRTGRWKRLIKPYDYELDSLHHVAPEHWLIEKLDASLKREFMLAKVSVSDMTRYRIVAAINRSAGLPVVEPLTIKEHLIEKARRNLAARNSTTD